MNITTKFISLKIQGKNMLNYEIQIANSPKNRGLNINLWVKSCYILGPQNKRYTKTKA